MISRKCILKLSAPALICALVLVAASSHAQTFPDKPITIVVPFSAGGGADLVARMLGKELSKHLDHAPIVIENKAGASGNIGASYVSRSKPDGYTLLLTNSTLTINASVGLTKGLDVKKELSPIANLVSTPIALAVNSKMPVNNVGELVAYARKNQDKLSYSSCGTGTPQHFAGAKFNLLTKLEIVHVPYKGCAPAVNDGVGNQVPILFSTIPNVGPHVQEGTLRMLGIASKNRLSFMPDVAAISETEPFRDMDITVWFGLFAPSAVPQAIQEKIEAAVLLTMKDPSLQNDFKSRFYEIDIRDAKNMSQLVDHDLATYKKLAKQSNITLN